MGGGSDVVATTVNATTIDVATVATTVVFATVGASVKCMVE